MSDPLPSDTLDRLEEAEQLKLMGRNKEALSILERLLIEDPENVSALEEVADNELHMEHYDRAEVAAIRALALDRNSYTALYILGFIHSVQEEWDKAIERLQKANALKPNNAEILRCLGWALFSSNQKAQGLVTLERALNLDNENPLTLCDLGVTYLQIQNTTKAKALFLRALDLDPSNERAKKCVETLKQLEAKSGVREQQI